ncbi:MAG: putative ring and ubiquitin domain containing protein [Streblomastix strix]|uniref:Putative ring and ubiquitin domain containing protein n=1 Tax=Streblomastix strix TaxID=222440 RepID=A0A5J4V2Y5_9EUKA|nr:MAG: putative ring and ubiquitin domain containing protein [Streblomastix strix]
MCMCMYRGDILSNDETLEENGIKEDGCELQLETEMNMNINIKLKSGKLIELDVEKENTIEIIKKKIKQQTGMDINTLKLIYQGKQLDNQKTLLDYKIQKDSTLNTEVITIKNTELGQIELANVEGTKLLVVRDQSSSAPKWRIVTKGLSIEGICSNMNCVAYNRMTIFNSGFTDVELWQSGAKCPMCQNQINPIKPAFNNCLYRIDLHQKKGQIKKLPWQRVGNEYLSFDEQNTYIRLVAHTRQIITSQDIRSVDYSYIGDCGLCHKEKDVDVVVMKCGHSFHKNCMQVSKDRGYKCPYCDQELEEI